MIYLLGRQRDVVIKPSYSSPQTGRPCPQSCRMGPSSFPSQLPESTRGSFLTALQWWSLPLVRVRLVLLQSSPLTLPHSAFSPPFLPLPPSLGWSNWRGKQPVETVFPRTSPAPTFHSPFTSEWWPPSRIYSRLSAVLPKPSIAARRRRSDNMQAASIKDDIFC